MKFHRKIKKAFRGSCCIYLHILYIFSFNHTSFFSDPSTYTRSLIHIWYTTLDFFLFHFPPLYRAWRYAFVQTALHNGRPLRKWGRRIRRWYKLSASKLLVLLFSITLRLAGTWPSHAILFGGHQHVTLWY